MRQSRSGSGSEVVQQSVEFIRTSLLSLLLLRVQSSCRFVRSYDLCNHKDRKGSQGNQECAPEYLVQCGPNMGSLISSPPPSLAAFVLEISQREGTVDCSQNKLQGVLPRRLLRVWLRCYRRCSMVRVRKQSKEFQPDQTNLFGIYSYCHIGAFESGDV